MQTYPYLFSTDKLDAFIKRLGEIAVPSKFTFRHLSSIGFSSSQERSFIPLLQFLGFLTEQNVPTEDYFRLRDTTDYKRVIQEKVEEAYKQIFDFDTRAHSVPEAVLVGYFGRVCPDPHKTLELMARTFKALCALGNFSSQERASSVIKDASAKVKLSIELPATTDEKVYEAIFKHLKGLIG